MSTRWGIILFAGTAVVLAAASAFAGSDERSVLWQGFDRPLDYSRLVRTAEAARNWIVVEDEIQSGNSVLRVDYRFDETGENSLLVFDLVPITLERIVIRVRVPEQAGSPVRINIAANSVDNEGFVGPLTTLPANGKWTYVSLDLSQPLAAIYVKGEKQASSQLTSEQIHASAIARLFIHVRLPGNSATRFGQDFTLDFDLLEGFRPSEEI